MGELQLSKIAKIGCSIFIFYAIWFRYVHGEMHIILYGSVAVAMVFMLFDMWFNQRNLMEMCPIGVLMNFVMCAYSIVTGLWVASNQEALLNLVKTYASYSIVCMVICYVSKEEGSLRWITNTLIVVDLLSAVFVIFRGHPYIGYGYVLGPEQNPNSLGVMMDVGLLCLAYKTKHDPKRTPLYLCCALLFLFTIVNSGSRKSLIAAGIFLAMWLYPLFIDMWKKGNATKRVLLVAGLSLIIGAVIYYFVVYFASTDIFLRMQKLGDTNEFSSNNRKLYYKYAIDYFSEHPVFGIGLGQFIYWNPFHQMSHSTYAEAISCWGTVGCLLYFTPALIALFRSVSLLLLGEDKYMARVLFAMFVMEIFLGVGQVWFYEIEHLLCWTIVFYLVDELMESQVPEPKSVCKYVRA